MYFNVIVRAEPTVLENSSNHVKILFYELISCKNFALKLFVPVSPLFSWAENLDFRLYPRVN